MSDGGEQLLTVGDQARLRRLFIDALLALETDSGFTALHFCGVSNRLQSVMSDITKAPDVPLWRVDFDPVTGDVSAGKTAFHQQPRTLGTRSAIVRCRTPEDAVGVAREMLGLKVVGE